MLQYEARNPGNGNRRGRDGHHLGRDSDALGDGARVGGHHSLLGGHTVPDGISRIFGHCRCEVGEATWEHAPERWAKGMRGHRSRTLTG